jgi:activator of HSP90 ATPase
MSKTITQSVTFKNTTTKELYNFYMDTKKHWIVTGAVAKIGPKEGDKYSAYDGYATGKNLKLVKDKLIVQTWRASNWSKETMDSVFVLNFSQSGNDVVVDMTHANLPDAEAGSLKKGWDEYYWKPWKSYLK